MSKQGRFVWYELMTTDTAAAPAFYQAVAALGTQAWEGSDYTMWIGANGPVGGLMTLPDKAKEMGAPPHWLGYVSVADVDATVARATALGARVYVPPSDIPNNAGRFAVLGDPGGAAFGVHGGGSQNPERPPLGLGDFIWHELVVPNLDQAWAFYSELFGWAKTSSMEMGPGMGIYQMFGRPGEDSMGGMMAHPPDQPRAAWVYYLVVENCDASVAAATERGATVLYPPMEVPGGDRVSLLMDPQGAAIGVCQRAKKD